MMETQIEMFNDHLVVAIQGRLDTTQSDAFEKKCWSYSKQMQIK
jgi:anti-anti-sigma regulatory factor